VWLRTQPDAALHAPTPAGLAGLRALFASLLHEPDGGSLGCSITNSAVEFGGDRDALSAYMDAFQTSAPGALFRIGSVRHRHDRSLACWKLEGRDGQELRTGASVAFHDRDGRLRAVTGFFDPSGPGTPQ
jgi:hypothetical protein